MFSARSVTSAAKAGAEKKPVIAAVNRCATQNQAQTRLFRQPARRRALMELNQRDGRRKAGRLIGDGHYVVGTLIV